MIPSMAVSVAGAKPTAVPPVLQGHDEVIQSTGAKMMLFTGSFHLFFYQLLQLLKLRAMLKILDHGFKEQQTMEIPAMHNKATFLYTLMLPQMLLHLTTEVNFMCLHKWKYLAAICSMEVSVHTCTPDMAEAGNSFKSIVKYHVPHKSVLLNSCSSYDSKPIFTQ